MSDVRAGREPIEALDPLNRFSDRAADYVRHRPDYPAAAIDAVLDGLGAPERLAAADIGAGTGISSRQLADRGVRVIAVEPNAAMREAAEPHPRVEWRAGSAEATGLEAGSVDLVLAAQAYHWFRPIPALTEFHRVLRPGGRLALMWNRRDRDDALTRAYSEAIEAVNGGRTTERLAMDMAVDFEILPKSGLFAEAERKEVTHARRFDLEGLIGLATSASYVPKEGEPLARLRALLTEAFERHREPDGRVTMRYRTEVWRSNSR